MKIINLLLTIVFALFALFQYNDLDAWNWIMLYLFVATVSFFAFREKYNKGILMISLILMLLWMGTLFGGFWNWIQDGMPSIVDEMQANSPYIEIVREFLGLLISFITISFHYFQSRKVLQNSN